jgi:AAA domain
MSTPDRPVPYRTLPAARVAETTAPVRWLLDGLFLAGGAGILGGAPKTGKSFLALELAVAVASGTLGAGHWAVATPGPVLLLAAEDPLAVVVQRLTALAAARARTLVTLPVDLIVEPSVRLPDGLPRLAATVAQRRPVLLILDPLIRVHRADENSAPEMAAVLDGLRTLARDSGCAVLLVHHARKAPALSSLGHGLRGSSDLPAFGDSNLYLRRLGANGPLELRPPRRGRHRPLRPRGRRPGQPAPRAPPDPCPPRARPALHRHAQDGPRGPQASARRSLAHPGRRRPPRPRRTGRLDGGAPVCSGSSPYRWEPERKH